jgi:hypothetical protein
MLAARGLEAVRDLTHLIGRSNEPSMQSTNCNKACVKGNSALLWKAANSNQVMLLRLLLLSFQLALCRGDMSGGSTPQPEKCCMARVTCQVYVSVPWCFAVCSGACRTLC